MESLKSPPEQEQTSDRAELAQIDDLKRGFSPFFEQLGGLAASSQKVLISNVFTPEIRTALQEHRSELDSCLARFTNMCKEMPVALMKDTLEKTANREFHNYFTQQFSPHRLAFIVQARAYASLKQFQLEAEENLHRIHGIVTNAEIPKNSEFYAQLLNYRIAPALRLVEAVRIYCLRVSILLGMPEEPSNLKSLWAHTVYLPNVEYEFSAVFAQNLRDVIDQALAEENAQRPDVEAPPPPKKQARIAPTAATQDHVLNTSGGMTWNTGADYYFSYDPEKLAVEREAMQSVVYIDTHMGADSDMLKGDIIRNIARRETNESPEQIETRYVSFLQTYFALVGDISTLNLGIPSDRKLLFLYHLGPSAFFMLTRRFLHEASTGTFHTRGGKMMKKYIPLELLRKTVLDWYRNHVLPAVANDRDDPGAYKSLLKPIKAAHRDLSTRAVEYYEALPPAAKQGKVRSEVFREHMNEWFGATNIIVFKRFLKSKPE